MQVGVNGLPNVFEESYGTLDFTVAQRLGNGEIKLALGNLLDPKIEQNQGSGDEKKIIQRYTRGINISLGYNHRL